MMKIMILASKIIASINGTIATILWDNNLVLKWINYEVEDGVLYINEGAGLLSTKRERTVALPAECDK